MKNIEKILKKVIRYIPCGLAEDIRYGRVSITTSKSGKSIYIKREIPYIARGVVDFVSITRRRGGYKIYIHRLSNGGEPWEEEYFLPD